MKKHFMILLSALMLVTMVFAAEENENETFSEGCIYGPSEYFCYDAFDSDNASLMADENYEEVLAKIYDALVNTQDSISFDHDSLVFELTSENYDSNGNFVPVQFSDLLGGLLDRHPELFYVGSSYAYAKSTNILKGTYTITSLVPSYTIAKSDIPSKKIRFEALTDEIAEYVNENAKSDLEKVMLMHDYLAVNYEYDTTYTCYDAYNLMTKGTGVCAAYSKLFRYVMDKCSVESLYSSSKSLNHVWNIVKIDEKWYHVDATWDDPVPDLPGAVRYTNFLIGDADFADPTVFSSPHTGFVNEAGVVCEESYHDAFWGHMASGITEGYKYANYAPIVFDDNNFYYTVYNKSTYTCAVAARSKVDGTERFVASYEGIWYIPGATGSYYPGNFSGLSLIDGVLIYNTPTEIRYILPDCTHDTLIYKLEDVSDGYLYLFGTSIDGKFNNREPFYTHIDPDNIGRDDNDSYTGHYKDGKDMYQVEIDCFKASKPGAAVSEIDVDIHIAFSDIHNVVEDVIRKPTFITYGKTEKHCTECHAADETIITDPYCKEGEDAHEPNVEDLVNIIRCIIGTGSHSGDKDTDHSHNDIDGDGTLSLHDINEIFRVLREEAAEE